MLAAALRTRPRCADARVSLRRRAACRVSGSGRSSTCRTATSGPSIDANCAAAWAGLAEVYDRQVGDGQRPIEEGFRLVREAVGKALAIDPEFAPAHDGLGRLAMIYDGDPAAALAAIKSM